MAEISLYNSTVCRLCAEVNDKGELLFTDEFEETELSSMINRYLPLKVYNDGKLPRTICPGCNIQLEATVQFFDLLVRGQQKLQELWSSVSETNEKQIIIKVMPDGSIYTDEHDLTLQMNWLDKPKKRRGRPPKITTAEEPNELEKIEYTEEINEGEDYKQDEEEFDADGKRSRRRKVPKRYMEAVQGKELEKIFKDEGVFDEDDIQIKYEADENSNNLSADGSNSETEVIGHLENLEGKNLGQLVVVNKNKTLTKSKLQKSRIKRKKKFICSYCGKGFLQRSKYITHQSFHKTVKYQCNLCKNEFCDNESLIYHQKNVNHSGDNVIEISSESKDIDGTTQNTIDIELQNIDESTHTTLINTSLEATSLTNIEDDTLSDENQSQDMEMEEILIENQESQNSDVTFKCNKCHKHFQTNQNLEDHIKVVHQGKKPFLCQLCDKAFAYESSLKGHIEINHQINTLDNGFPCEMCGKIFNHTSSMMYHKLTEHNNSRRFICNKCGKSFKHKQLLQRHQLVHSDDRPYPCNSCDASFKTKANLLNHQSTHTGEKKHFCELCNQKFAHKTSLTLHYRTHTGQKPYKCDICSKSFSQNGNLQEHMRIHTGEKPYCCDHCGRKFTTSSQFKLHVKRHTGERPWKCEYCPKSFLHKDTWKCHVRRHTGERPFECNYCQRGFTEQWALKKHLRLHTGEKPYNCDVCGKAFADCSNLTKHKKVHKKIDTTVIQTSSATKEIWKKEIQNSFNSSKDEVIVPDNIAHDMSQIIYVTYQDPDHSQEATVQLNKENVVDSEEINVNLTEEDENEINMDYEEDADLQLQISDEHGNTIPISMQQARQLFTEGHFISQLNKDNAIKLQHLPTALEDNSNVQISSVCLKNKNYSASSTQADAEAIAKVLENEDTDDTTNEVSNQINTENPLEINNSQQTIEFITQDGQKVRVVTSLNLDPSQLPSEYLTIV